MPQSKRVQGILVTITGGARIVCAAIVAAAVLLPRDSLAVADEAEGAVQSEQSVESKSEPAFKNELIRGKVVWLADALKSEFGISTVPEVAENSLAILTKDGKLVPMVENLRGRAFRSDKRLREMEVELLARRYEQQPLIQVLRLYQVDGDQRYEIDYWCDICAIVMFETGPCSCCQDHNRLRKRIVERGETTPTEVETEAE